MNEIFREGFEKVATIKSFFAKNIGRGVGGAFGKPKLGRPVMPTNMMNAKMKAMKKVRAEGKISHGKPQLNVQKLNNMANIAKRKAESGLGKFKRAIKNKLGV